MDNSGFQKMVVDLVEVGNWPDDMCTNISFVPHRVQSPPDSYVAIFSDILPVQTLIIIVPIVPNLDFDSSCAVIQFVCDFCGLLRDIPDLGNECALLMLVGWKYSHGGRKSYLRNLRIVYLEVFLANLLGFVQLLDGHRPKTIVSLSLPTSSATRKLIQS